MTKFLTVISILVLCALILLIATKKLNLQPAKPIEEAVDKAFIPIEEPIKTKQTTEEKLKQIEEELEEKNQKLLEDMDRYK